MSKFQYDKNSKKNIENISKVNPIIAEMLYNRGFKSEKEMLDLLNETPALSFEEYKDEIKAAEIISAVIKNKETIVIYSDTDTDGAISGAVGLILLKRLGADVYCYTNNKFTDGYGLCKTGIDNILKAHPTTSLILTADNGIAAMDISYAKELGLKVVVTDHHEPNDILPDADAIVDPKQKGCPSTFKEMCGAGVLYQVLRRVYSLLGRKEDETEDVLEYVSIATVGDVVPLLNINRAIVKFGISIMNSNPSLPIKIFKEKLNLASIDAHGTIAFTITPMINSLSRMEGIITPAIELFTSSDEAKISEIIDHMIKLNDLRKEKTAEQTEAAMILAEREVQNKIIILQDDSFDGGIAGIVAGKVKEKYNLPTIILSAPNKDGVISGSARSIDGLHIKDLLVDSSTHLLSFGGHAKAAGLSLKIEDLDKFKKEIINNLSKIASTIDFEKHFNLDAVMTTYDLSFELIDEINKLEPFGEGFPPPLFGLTFEVTNVYYMGNNKQHLKCYDSGTDTSVICWDGAKKYNNSSKPLRKAIGYPSINTYNGKSSIQFIVKEDFLFPKKNIS